MQFRLYMLWLVLQTDVQQRPVQYAGDYSMSYQENIVHTSDSPETAATELNRFFEPEEIFAVPAASLILFMPVIEY